MIKNTQSSSIKSINICISSRKNMDLQEHAEDRKGKNNREEDFQDKENINVRTVLESCLLKFQNMMDDLKKDIEGVNSDEVRSNREGSSDKHYKYIDDDYSSIDPFKE